MLACIILLSELVVYAPEVATRQVFLRSAVVLVTRLVGVHIVGMGALVLEDGHVLDVYSLGGQGIVKLSLSLVHADRLRLDANSTTSCIRKSIRGMEEGIVATERSIRTR